MCSNRVKKKRFLRQLSFLGLLVGIAYLAANLGLLSSHPGSLVCVFERPDGTRTKRFFLEAATNDSERAKGLMYRRSGELSDNEGMIFVFPEEKELAFWMRNTFISLDMLFLNADLEIRGVLTDVPTLNDEPRTIGGRSKFVVELLAGAAETNRLDAGAKLQCETPIPKGV